MYLCKAIAKVINFVRMQKLSPFFYQRMEHFKNISTLIFDLGGVIINLDLPLCIQNINKLGIDNVEKYLSNFGQSDFFLQFEKGQISVPEFREQLRRLSTREILDAEIDAAWCSFLVDIPQKRIDLLSKLKKQFRIVALSNTNPLHIEISLANEFAKAGKAIDDIFDACYFSYEMHMAKPDIEIFETLLEHERVSAGNCLFLDDGLKNIEQARKSGFQTHWVQKNQSLDFLLDPETFR